MELSNQFELNRNKQEVADISFLLPKVLTGFPYLASDHSEPILDFGPDVFVTFRRLRTSNFDLVKIDVLNYSKIVLCESTSWPCASIKTLPTVLPKGMLNN